MKGVEAIYFGFNIAAGNIFKTVKEKRHYLYRAKVTLPRLFILCTFWSKYISLLFSH